MWVDGVGGWCEWVVWMVWFIQCTPYLLFTPSREILVNVVPRACLDVARSAAGEINGLKFA